MEGGKGVALAYLETAMKAPVDCQQFLNYVKKTHIDLLIHLTHVKEQNSAPWLKHAKADGLKKENGSRKVIGRMD